MWQSFKSPAFSRWTSIFYWIIDVNRYIVPFTNSDEMDEALIKALNDTVPEDGIVFHLGDFCDNSQYNKYTSSLNGNIHLIQGNHDRIAENQQFASIS